MPKDTREIKLPDGTTLLREIPYERLSNGSVLITGETKYYVNGQRVGYWDYEDDVLTVGDKPLYT